MYSPLVFIALATAVASLHMIAPDHWLPLTALSLKEGYKRRRVLEISTVLGFLHGSTSVLLSMLALFVGVSAFGLNDLKEVSIVVLVMVAIYVLANTLREKKGSKNIQSTSLIVSILPDPVLLPIIMASYPLGNVELTVISVTFIVVSILALLVVLGVVMTGVVKNLSKLKPTTVDYILVVALFLTSIYIYFYG